jgi:hypothetical protein
MMVRVPISLTFTILTRQCGVRLHLHLSCLNWTHMPLFLLEM